MAVAVTRNKVVVTDKSGNFTGSVSQTKQGPQGPVGDPAQPRIGNMQLNGHSYIDDNGVGVAQKESTSRKNKNIFGVPDQGFQNIAVSGGIVNDPSRDGSARETLQKIVPNQAWPYSGDAGVVGIMFGTNDAVFGYNSSVNKAYKESMRAVIARYFAAKVYEHDTTDNNGKFLFSGEWEDVRWGSGTPQASGKGYWITRTTGAYTTFKTPDDFENNYIHIGWIGAAEGGTADVYVDNVVVGSFDTSGMRASINTAGIYRCPVPAGAHTIKIQCTGITAAGSLQINYWQIEATNKPVVMLMSMHMSSNSTGPWGALIDPTIHDNFNILQQELIDEWNEPSLIYSNTDAATGGLTWVTDGSGKALEKTATTWRADITTVPALSALCLETDTGILRIGDGVNIYKNLPLATLAQVAVATATTNRISKTAAAWAADASTILKTHQMGFATDTLAFKIGDGINTYANLSNTYRTIVSYKGLWNNATAYVLGDAVYNASNGLTYVCVSAHTNQAIPNPTYWSTYNTQHASAFVTMQKAGIKNNHMAFFSAELDSSGLATSKTSTEWLADVSVPVSGKVCYNSDTKQFRIGDGTRTYANLPQTNPYGAAIILVQQAGNRVDNTAAGWAADSTTILQPWQMGYETDTAKFKVGNGVNAYANLSTFVTDTCNLINAQKRGVNTYVGSNAKYYATDGLHPNATGAAVIAETNYKACNEALTKEKIKGRHFDGMWSGEKAVSFSTPARAYVGAGEGAKYEHLDVFSTDDGYPAYVYATYSNTGIGGTWSELQGIWGKDEKGQITTFSPAPGTTSHYDTFDRANSLTTLGSPWVSALGTWGVQNNTAYLVTSADPINCAYVETSSTDHYVEFIIGGTAQANAFGGAVRFADNTHAIYTSTNALGINVMQKDGAGAATTLISNLGGSNAGTRVRLEVVGTTVYLYINGTRSATTGTTTLTTQTKAGLYAANAGVVGKASMARVGIPTNTATRGPYGIAVIDKGWSDGFVEVKVDKNRILDYIGIVYRVQDAANYYQLLYSKTFGTYSWQVIVAGVATQLAFGFGSVAPQETLRVEFKGNVHTCYTNGTVVTWMNGIADTSNAGGPRFLTGTKQGISAPHSGTEKHGYKYVAMGQHYFLPNNGDIYLDTTGGKVYGPYSNGGYPTATNFGAAGNVPNVVQATGTVTANVNDVVVCDTTAGGFTVNLVTAVGNTGKTLTVKKKSADANNVTVDANGAQTIDGALTVVFNIQWTSITFQSDGANWIVI